MRNFIAATFLSTALLVPAMTNAQDRDDHRDRDEHHDQRVYDRAHKDYHDWNDAEEQAWHGYLESRHRTYVVYTKASSREQRAYWNWRHQHPDSDRR